MCYSDVVYYKCAKSYKIPRDSGYLSKFFATGHCCTGLQRWSASTPSESSDRDINEPALWYTWMSVNLVLMMLQCSIGDRAHFASILLCHLRVVWW